MLKWLTDRLAPELRPPAARPTAPPDARPISWVVDEIPCESSEYWRDFRSGAVFLRGDGRHQNFGRCVACHNPAEQETDCTPAIDDMLDSRVFAGVQNDDVMPFAVWFDMHYVLVIPRTTEPSEPASAFVQSPDRTYPGNYARGQKLVKEWWRVAMRPELREQLTLNPRPGLVKVAYGTRIPVAGLFAARVPDGTVVGSDGHYVAESEDEAAYLTAVLNAPALQLAFAHCGTYYFGHDQRDSAARHFFRVPVPRYDPENILHQRLAALCAEAEAVANATFEDLPTRFEVYWITGIMDQKWSEIRQCLMDSGIAGRIDDAVRELLPNHAVRVYSPASPHPWQNPHTSWRISMRTRWRTRMRPRPGNTSTRPRSRSRRRRS